MQLGAQNNNTRFARRDVRRRLHRLLLTGAVLHAPNLGAEARVSRGRGTDSRSRIGFCRASGWLLLNEIRAPLQSWVES